MKFKAFSRYVMAVLVLTVLLSGVFLSSTPTVVNAEGGASSPIPSDSTGGDCVGIDPEPPGGDDLLTTILIMTQIIL